MAGLEPAAGAQLVGDAAAHPEADAAPFSNNDSVSDGGNGSGNDTQATGGRMAWPPPRLVTANSSLDAQLSRLVELEVIPRLLLMHGTTAAPPHLRSRSHARQHGNSHAHPVAQVLLSDMHVDVLARLAVEGDAGSAATYVNALLDAGASDEQVFLELLAPAARLLGIKWEDDVYDFSQVTIALWRLQQILHDHRGHGPQDDADGVAKGRALLAAPPGSQHSFGVSLVGELFGRAGWDVHQVIGRDWPTLKKTVTENWFDMIGFSAGTASDVSQIASAILDFRKVSMNARLLVMVGGPATGNADLVRDLQAADLIARDVGQALEFANRWVGEAGAEA